MPVEQTLSRVEIYTDGGCDPNPGPGGWGAVLIFGGQTKEISGADPHTTNNRMELTAAIEALKVLQRPCDIVLHTDSQYLRRGITEWLPQWQARGWRRANGQPVRNQDLWQDLAQEIERHQVDWRWIKGHSGHRYNERADRLAAQARRRLLARSAGGGAPEGANADLPTDFGSLPQVDIYARACALGVPGPGGYAAILVHATDRVEEISGGWPLATSNVMELWAAVAGLQALSGPSKVTLHTTSKYVFEGATRWMAGWERHNWRKKDGSSVKNKEIWLELARAMGDHDVTWRHLRKNRSQTFAEIGQSLRSGDLHRNRAKSPISRGGDSHSRRAARLARARAEEIKAGQRR